MKNLYRCYTTEDLNEYEAQLIERIGDYLFVKTIADEIGSVELAQATIMETRTYFDRESLQGSAFENATETAHFKANFEEDGFCTIDLKEGCKLPKITVFGIGDYSVEW